MVICLELGEDLHMAQLMPLPLTVSCFSKIHIGFTFLVLAHPGSPGRRAIKRVYVCMYAATTTTTNTSGSSQHRLAYERSCPMLSPVSTLTEVTLYAMCGNQPTTL